MCQELSWRVCKLEPSTLSISKNCVHPNVVVFEYLLQSARKASETVSPYCHVYERKGRMDNQSKQEAFSSSLTEYHLFALLPSFSLPPCSLITFSSKTLALFSLDSIAPLNNGHNIRPLFACSSAKFGPLQPLS